MAATDPPAHTPSPPSPSSASASSASVPASSAPPSAQSSPRRAQAQTQAQTQSQGPFAPATGDGPPHSESAELRAAAVRTALDGLLQIRRLTQGSETAPAPWELRQLLNAVALPLEAAPLPPSATGPEGHRTATGYRVRPGEEPHTAAVDWLGPPGSGAAAQERDQLARCAEVLTALGWDALLYRGPRRRWFVEVRPPHGTS